MGGMAAQIPIKNDPENNEKALNKVREDKEREVNLGHDGTWIAHPGLVSIAMEAFKKMPTPNQIDRQLDVQISAQELLQVPKGNITREGVRINNSVGVQYLESWLRGNGCVPLYNLMEDAATAEISRTQIWQWIHHNQKIDGLALSPDRFQSYLQEDLAEVQMEIGEEKYAQGKFKEAAELFERLSTDECLSEFLTLPAYELL